MTGKLQEPKDKRGFAGCYGIQMTLVHKIKKEIVFHGEINFICSTR